MVSLVSMAATLAVATAAGRMFWQASQYETQATAGALSMILKKGTSVAAPQPWTVMLIGSVLLTSFLLSLQLARYGLDLIQNRPFEVLLRSWVRRRAFFAAMIVPVGTPLYLQLQRFESAFEPIVSPVIESRRLLVMLAALSFFELASTAAIAYLVIRLTQRRLSSDLANTKARFP